MSAWATPYRNSWHHHPSVLSSCRYQEPSGVPAQTKLERRGHNVALGHKWLRFFKKRSPSLGKINGTRGYSRKCATHSDLTLFNAEWDGPWNIIGPCPTLPPALKRVGSLWVADARVPFIFPRDGTPLHPQHSPLMMHSQPHVGESSAAHSGLDRGEVCGHWRWGSPERATLPATLQIFKREETATLYFLKGCR